MSFQYTSKDVDRFWSHVDKSGECWNWMGGKRWNGYGRIKISG